MLRKENDNILFIENNLGNSYISVKSLRILNFNNW